MKKLILSLVFVFLCLSLMVLAEDPLSAFRMTETYRGVHVYAYHHPVKADHPLWQIAGPETKIYTFEFTAEYLTILEIEQMERETIKESVDKATLLYGPDNFYHPLWIPQGAQGTSEVLTDNNYSPPHYLQRISLDGTMRWYMARVEKSIGGPYIFTWAQPGDWLDETFDWISWYPEEAPNSQFVEMTQAVQFTGPGDAGRGYYDHHIPSDAYGVQGEYRFLSYRFYPDPNYKPPYLIADHLEYTTFYVPYAEVGEKQ